ncbi:hypothetical protein AOC05_05015 [Arthrobacter alpinus]|uniref:Uncharacterized protein n=1 Tax=Arthrobacter alpinus TaxID=656366 RepID=A0A0M4RMV3_9MICC|nr:hypothetical protein [Arthrobacter alpinus]ALE91833.1 hypothetical protein AOC05_05015 [Arthrobacter alpinus]
MDHYWCDCCDKPFKTLMLGEIEDPSKMRFASMSTLSNALSIGVQSNLPMWASFSPEEAKEWAFDCQYIEGVDWLNIAALANDFWGDAENSSRAWSQEELTKHLRGLGGRLLNGKETELFVSIFSEPIELQANGGFLNGRHRAHAMRISGVDKVPVLYVE